jgi:hypothetical protein
MTGNKSTQTQPVTLPNTPTGLGPPQSSPVQPCPFGVYRRKRKEKGKQIKEGLWSGESKGGESRVILFLLFLLLLLRLLLVLVVLVLGLVVVLLSSWRGC